MKQDLKNKMDQIDHTFDQDALWSKIDYNKNKKRRRIFWLVPIVGLLVFSGIVYFVANSIDSSSLDNEVSSPVTKSQNSIIPLSKGQSYTDNTVDQDEESSNEMNLLNQPVFGSNTISKKKTQKATPTYKGNDTKIIDNNSINSALSKASEATSKKPVSANIIEKDLSIHTNIIEVLHDQTSENSQTNAVDKESSIIRKNTSEEKSIPLQVSSLGRLDQLAPSVNYIHPTFDLIKELEDVIKPKKEKRFVLGLKAGIGYDFHSFSPDSLSTNRNNYEKPLEALSLGAFVNKRFKNNIILEGNLRWTKSQTKAERSELSSSFSLAKGTNEIIQEWEKTDYINYNEYYRLDASIGIGYTFDLPKDWAIVPIVSIGYSIANYQRGEYWNTTLKSIDLKEAPEYRSNTSLFVEGAVGLHKSWSNNIQTGLNIGVQTSRFLTRDFGIRHKITPVSFHFTCGKWF